MLYFFQADHKRPVGDKLDIKERMCYNTGKKITFYGGIFMLYCEDCKRLCASERDCICGSNTLREANPQDYCFLLEANDSFAEMLEDCFINNGIECVLIPSGNGYRSALGLSLGNYIICVPYAQYHAATDIVEYFHQDTQNTIRDDLINHRDLWNANKRSQRKLRKKLKLTDADDLFDCINDVLCNAETISDDGLIGSCEYAGHYIAVRTEKIRFWFNSATYEIFL